MKQIYGIALIVLAAVTATACCNQEEDTAQGLVIEKQGVFSSGGRVTDPVPGSRFAHLAANTNPDRPGVEWYDLLPADEYQALPKE